MAQNMTESNWPLLDSHTVSFPEMDTSQPGSSGSSFHDSSKASISSRASRDNNISYGMGDHLRILNALQDDNLDNEDAILALPGRRNKTQRPVALQLAQKLYPELTEVAAIIKYDVLVRQGKAAIRQKRRDRIQPKNNKGGKLFRVQGPWSGQEVDPVDLNGPMAIPMPVTIGTAEDFRPVFDFLTADKPITEVSSSTGTHGYELLWKTPFVEFERGIVYEDGRLDLCKKVVGPTHIGALMNSLESNHQISHFLLGNNAISATGAKSIAEFLQKHPDRIETWYLAGCHITRHGLSILVPQMTKSTTITNLWFKRNPFGPDAGALLAELVIGTANLRTLDLETTELGDEGTRQFIDAICGKPLALRHLYLNANGIGKSACASLAKYLAHPHCALESLFISTNPIGDAGVQELSAGLLKNKSLKRLMLASAGLTNNGVTCLADAIVQGAAPMQTIDFGASQTTKAHSARYNYLDNGCVKALQSLVMKPTMRWLSLGHVTISETGMGQIKSSAAHSQLVYFDAFCVEVPHSKHSPGETETYEGRRIVTSCSVELRHALATNQAKFYPDIKTYSEFLRSEELRFLRNTDDVRKIDSQYRAMDKRMGLPMDTPWEEGDLTWKLILDDAKLAEGEDTGDAMNS